MANEAHEHMLDANGLRFRALRWQGTGATALFIHATSFCADGWRPVVAELQQSTSKSPRVVAIDQRGHGGSDAPTDPAAYQWTHLAEDIAALASKLAAEDPMRSSVIGVGHSSGATSLLAAAGMHPERFAALVAIEPVLWGEPASGGADSFAGSSLLASAARRRRDRFASREDARERLRTKPPFASFDPIAFDAVLPGMLAIDRDGVMLRCPGEREATCYEGAAALELWPLAAQIRAPLLLVLGERGAVAPTLRDRFVATLPSVQVVVIPGGSHFVALERPREVGAAIGRFLAERR
jgi:pimeloyl-ACP methyl ester carboxylesterase